MSWLTLLNKHIALIEKMPVRDNVQTTFLPLPQLSCLTLEGRDHLTLLQKYTTSDIESLSPFTNQHSALCNLQGRTVASFEILRCDSHALLLMESSLVNCFLDTLQPYLAFFKSTCNNESDKYAIFAIHINDPLLETYLDNNTLHIPSSSEIIAEDKTLIFKSTLPNYLYILTEAFDDITHSKKLDPSILQHYIEQWRLLCIQLKKPYLTSATSGKHLPQSIGLAMIDGVLSWDKGCYMGQAIVARIEHRSALKHHLYKGHYLSSSSQINLTEHAVLLDQSGNAVGNLLLYAASPITPINDQNTAQFRVDFLAVCSHNKMKDSNYSIADEIIETVELCNVVEE